MKKRVSIHIGDYYASSEPAVVHTLLGSCVAVCLFDPTKRTGGVNHILLPGRADMVQFNTSARYGVNAMELLINAIMGLGGERNQLVAKVFGGAHILGAISEENSVGKKNIAFVLEFLEKESIKIINQDLGGYDTRTIFFHTDTGDVFLKRTSHNMYNKMIAKKEKDLLKRIKKQTKEQGKVDLF
ncbi:MAG: chemotaxis protein CheD [Deltaproteobacteria bacterium]|nr:chemotaxis protein CheD [Deltaproteobacteria bacterium]MBW1960214.1 chemotaxis protein CheD [Deltaproteobacteria bacterium]MBW1995370.1 chemotaxis protein CheD [Deltaproteobacteria bacterium]MBW2150617.1 chemotaxis protein CheD [Deltaproteobacteria bacterium]